MKNFYEKVKKEQELSNPQYGKTHMFKLNKHILICGTTGSGKSNTLLNIIERLNGSFLNIVLCTKLSDEPLYVLLKSKIPSMKIYEGYTKNEKNKNVPNVPSLESVNEKDDKGYEPTLVIFDDMVGDKDQDCISQFFIRGRKRNVTCIYLTQSYFKTPKTIRLQCQHILLKRGMQKRDLLCILRETSFNIDMRELLRIYNTTITKFEDFLHIDLLNNMLYISFDTEPYIKPDIDTHVELPERKKAKYVPLHRRGITKAMDEFVKVLKDNIQSKQIVGEYTIDDLYDCYIDYVHTTGDEAGTKQLLSRKMTDNEMKKNKRGGLVFYSFNC